MINTPAGKDGSKRYNSKRRLDTLRHAIIAQIRDPPKGFEEVTKRHFAMCRQRIVAQARRWTLEARGSPLEGRFLKAYGQLLNLLSEQAFDGRDCLPPLREDIAYLAREDPSFSVSGFKEDRKPSAVPQATMTNTIGQNEAEAFLAAVIATQSANTNPWASNQSTAANPWTMPSSSGAKDDYDEDDEMYD